MLSKQINQTSTLTHPSTVPFDGDDAPLYFSAYDVAVDIDNLYLGEALEHVQQVYVPWLLNGANVPRRVYVDLFISRAEHLRETDYTAYRQFMADHGRPITPGVNFWHVQMEGRDDE